MKKYTRIRFCAVLVFKLVLIAALTLLGSEGYSQSPLKLYSGITEEKWLPSNSVKVIFQDSKGFIWVGTNSGLFKYNLYAAVNFNLTQKSSGRLLNNTIHAIAEDVYGNILVGTESGLGVIDPNTGECTIMSSTDETITKIIAGKNNRIWVATGNGKIYRITAQPFKYYRSGLKSFTTVVNTKGVPLTISSIFEMPDNTVLLGTEGGIFKIDINKRTAIPTAFKNAVTRIFSYDFKHLYVGTQNDGLFLLNFSDRNRGDFKVSSIRLNSSPKADEHIVNVSGISKNYIVTATREHLYIAEKLNDLNSFKKIGVVSNTISGTITYLYVDRTANIWLGSTRGLFKIKRQSLLFNYFDTGIQNNNVVNSLMNDGKGSIWVATLANGLYVYNQKTNKIRKVNAPDNINTIKKASDGSVLAVTGSKLIQISNQNYPSEITVKPVMASLNSVQDMLEVAPGEWWLATWKDGLIRYLENGKTDSTDFFQKIKREIGKEAPVFCILKDSYQRVWIGTRGKGIFRVDLGTGKIRRYHKTGKESDRSNRILCLYEDSEKHIWIGTRGDGLLKYLPEADHFINYGLSNGLPSNSICAVQQNSSGTIWISTLNGIAEYKPKLKIEFQTYNVEDGIGRAEFNFNASAAGDSGEVFFANGSGFYSFKKVNNPRNIVFPIVFTGFEIFSKGTSSGYSSQDPAQNLRKIMNSERIVLNHEQNSFEISFATLDFTNPEKNRYLYRLVGLDSAWKFVQGAKTSIPFHNLPAGKYQLQVFASNSQGYWNDKPVFVDIVLEPYFLLSVRAYIVYALLFLAAIVVGCITFRNWYNLRKKFRLEREISQKQSQQMVLYTDLSHEIKNRLSLILGPLELALSDKRVNRAFLYNLYNQTQRLKRLTDQILNIRKTESGNFILNVSEENIVKLIERLYSESKPMAMIKGLDFSFNAKKDSITGWCDEELLEIITMNLLGNAIKYVNVSGWVELKVDAEYLGGNDLLNKNAKEGNYLVLAFSNTGEGIPKGEINKVTELFYRSSNAKLNAAEGAGVGLNLVARLVHLHHGVMEIMSEKGESTTITIHLPIDKFQYSISELKPNMITTPIVVPLEEIAGNPEESIKHIKARPCVKRKILVVDDRPELAALVKDCLRSDFEVTIAYSGKEALTILQSSDMELIISDLAMPGMDGLTFCLNVRSISKYKNVPFVILTGRNSEEQKLICFQHGVDDFIEKPFSPELLKWKIKTFLRQVKPGTPEKKDIIIVTPGGEMSETPEEVFIQKIVNTIEEFISKEYLDAEFLAEKVFMSRATFYRNMESLIGESPSVFIRKYRLKKAAKLLLSRHYNISATAAKVGFNDPRYFAKCFQKEFGLSPSQYLEKKSFNNLEK